MDRRSYIMFSNYRPSVRICMYIVIGHGLAEYLWICCNHHARDREEAVLARGLPDSSSQVLLGFREESTEAVINRRAIRTSKLHT
jgi:hypothetical protein